MKGAADISAKLQLRLPAGHVAANQDFVRKKVEQYLSDLFAGFGVPGGAKFSWEKQPPGVKTFEAAINGAPARLRFTTANSLDTPPDEFQIALCDDILRNRALFVTPQIVSHATSNAHETFRQFEEEGRERIVQVLFAQGFGLQRIQQFSPPTGAPEKTPEAWAEACIGGLEATRLVMHAHPGQIGPDDDPHDLNRLIESASYFVEAAFRIKGIPFPKMRGEEKNDFAADEVAFQINDLLFPTRKIGEVQIENVQFVNFLTHSGAFFLNRGSVHFLLASLETAHPNLLSLTRTRFSTDFIVNVLRNLAAENISVRSLARILEILAGGGRDFYRQQPGLTELPPLSETVHLTATDKRPEQLGVSDWSELVRLNLKNAIINRALPHFENASEMSCFYLEDSALGKILAFDSLDLEEQTSLCAALHRQIGANYLTPTGKIRPLVTAAAFRKKISDLIALEFPETPVFSFQECLPQIVARFDVGISL